MIVCPRCGGDNVASLSRAGHRRPKLVGRVVIRHHRCGTCSQDFRSYQIVPSPGDHETLGLIQDEMERTA